MKENKQPRTGTVFTAERRTKQPLMLTSAEVDEPKEIDLFALVLESVVLLLHDDNLTHPSVHRKPPWGLTSPLRHLWRVLGWLMKRVFPVLSPVAAAAFRFLKQYMQLSAYSLQQCTSCLVSGPFHSMRSLGLAPIEAACRVILDCGGTPCQV